MRGGAIGLVTTLGVLTATTPARADAKDLLAVRVLAVNQAHVPRHVLELAQHDASRIFSATGIRLHWTNALQDTDVPKGERPHLKVRIIRDSPDNRVGRKLGVALRSEDNRYLVAYAFYFRIENLADQIGADPAPVLGHVIAHEIGHLLLPYDSHTTTGIMGRGWDRGRVKGMGKGVLAFTPEHATLIRARVRSILANE
jgi:hypothetical protein